jgi:hypothetical protein
MALDRIERQCRYVAPAYKRRHDIMAKQSIGHI